MKKPQTRLIQIHRGSWEIAHYANTASGDARLGDMQAIAAWNDVSDAALAEGRTGVVRCILNNNKALEEALPGFVPQLVRGKLRFIARDAVKRLDRKYAHLVEQGVMHKALVQTHEGLAQSKNDYLLGQFSYADIAMAAVLEVVASVAIVEPPLGPATQLCWFDSELAIEFEALLDWRDRLAKNNATSYSQFITESASQPQHTA